MPPTTDALRDLLAAARTIAVVGLSPKSWRPSHSVSAYLQRAGYRIIPVRPATTGTILGEAVYPDLVTAAREAGPVDIVDVFRRSDAVAGLVPAILEVRPRLVWLQMGVVDAPSAGQIEEAGIPVVMDRCLAVDHQALLA
jgi:predicted CoA-binding protein